MFYAGEFVSGGFRPKLVSRVKEELKEQNARKRQKVRIVSIHFQRPITGGHNRFYKL